MVSKTSAHTRSSGSIPGGSAAESYDFRNPSTFTREHQRLIETALRAYADQTASVITAKLRASCSHELESLQQTTYSAFINSLPEETLLLAASLNPINSTALIHLPLDFAMLSIDLPLGGSGENDQPSRGLTEIENVLVGDLGSSLTGALRFSFDGIITWFPVLTGQYSSPEVAHAASPGDQILVATFRLEIQEEVFNTLLALPLTPILPPLATTLAARLAEQSGSKSRDFSIDLEARIRTAPVTVSVRLRPIQGRFADFANISVGDVFRLGHSPDSAWEVTSHGVVFAHALPGGEGTQAAFRVI
ncbi:MAG: flagellar motor switch protein FliM [Candidatus Nanopelagicales bacterium]